MTAAGSARAWARAVVAMFAVGWGANQFSSLLLAYREHEGLSAGVTDALFGAYAVGLIPALLVGGPVSDRVGRRVLGRAAVLTSVLATVVLALGVVGSGWLYPGRLLAGIASGLIFAPGTAWVKELSSPPHAPAGSEDSGARRAAIALSAGFGLGPLVAGIVAQWAPYPLVSPYVAHLVVIAVAGAAVWRAPETVRTRAGTGTGTAHAIEPAVRTRMLVRSALEPRFRGVVAPLAPWVFTAASLSLTLAPALVVKHTGSIEVAFAGVIAGLTLGTGVLVQPVARRLDAEEDVRTMAIGLGACVAGCLVGALTAITAAPALAILSAVLFGAGYGFCLVAGLLETQRIAEPDELAALTAVYYALTYIGFAAPLVLTLLTHFASYRVLLLGAALLALATLAIVLVNARRTRSACADVRADARR